MSNKERAGELDWRAQADEGGCTDWGISWAFDPRPPAPEPITVPRFLVLLILAMFVVSLVLAILADDGLAPWLPL